MGNGAGVGGGDYIGVRICRKLLSCTHNVCAFNVSCASIQSQNKTMNKGEVTKANI